jgi:hypothetical protein
MGQKKKTPQKKKKKKKKNKQTRERNSSTKILSPKNNLPIFLKNCTRQPYLPNLHKVLHKTNGFRITNLNSRKVIVEIIPTPKKRQSNSLTITLLHVANNTQLHKGKNTHTPPPQTPLPHPQRGHKKPKT